MLSRRVFGFGSLCTTLTASPLRAAQSVPIGIDNISFIFDHDAHQMVPEFGKLGVRLCEFHYETFLPRLGPPSIHPHVPMTQPERRKWLLTFPISHYVDIRKKYERAGITINSFYYEFYKDSTDEEVRVPFEIARALGTNKISCTTHLGQIDRLEGYAKARDFTLGLHNQSDVEPDRITAAEHFEKALRGRSSAVKATLDVGHFTACGGDPVSFIEKHHDRIMVVHFKDRKKSQGPVVAHGTGDTPLREILKLCKSRGYTFPLMIEREAMPSVDMLRDCLDFIKKSLA